MVGDPQIRRRQSAEYCRASPDGHGGPGATSDVAVTLGGSPGDGDKLKQFPRSRCVDGRHLMSEKGPTRCSPILDRWPNCASRSTPDHIDLPLQTTLILAENASPCWSIICLALAMREFDGLFRAGWLSGADASGAPCVPADVLSMTPQGFGNCPFREYGVADQEATRIRCVQLRPPHSALPPPTNPRKERFHIEPCDLPP